MRQSLFCGTTFLGLFPEQEKQGILVRKSKLTSAKHLYPIAAVGNTIEQLHIFVFLKVKKKILLPPILSLLFMYFQVSTALQRIISILPNVDSLYFNGNLV